MTTAGRRYPALLLALWLAHSPLLRAEPDLPADFLDAAPSVQLFRAYAEFKMGNYALARQMWLQVGGAARAEALFNLAILYEQGMGVAPDMASAVAYYRQAALAGSRAAAYQLGLIYHEGRSVRADALEAERWLYAAAIAGDREAAALLAGESQVSASSQLARIERELRAGNSEQALLALQALAASGQPQAMTRLAWLYEAGIGVSRDLAQAAALFRQAAERGEAQAQYALAVMLMTGAGQPVNPQQARYWLRQAADQGHQRAARALSDFGSPP